MGERQNNQAHWVARVASTLFAALVILLILSNSAQTGDVSGSRSVAVTEFLNETTESLGLSLRITELQIRKLAHFAEYSLLGISLLGCLRSYTTRIGTYVAWPLLAGLVTAVLDEFLQLHIPGRSGQVTDVLIDFGGVIVGHLLGACLLRLGKAFRNRKKRRYAK